MFKQFLAKLFGRRSTSLLNQARRSWFDSDPSAAVAAEASGKPKAVLEWEQAAQRSIDKTARPEELCGITPEMKPEHIREHLAMLYRRHNRAAASLDAALREEGELMLDAIVQCREKFLEPKEVA
jgi:hypothetical protein